MKIAMIGQKGMPATWGGVEKHVEELATRLVCANHKVTVYSRHWYSDAKDTTYRGVDLRFIPSVHTKNLDAITHTFFSTLDAIRQDFDVIHYHGVGPALLSWIPRIFKPSVKVVVTFHCVDRFHGKWGLFAKLMLRLGEWSACKFPHQTIVVSKSLEKYVKEKYNCEAEYIPNGAPLSIYPETQDALNKFELVKDKYLVVVSRLIAHKGIHYLIEAFRQLKEENNETTKDLKLVIVGSGVHTDDYVSYLQTIANDVEGVVFTGWQMNKDLAELIAGAKLFVHPSNSEGLPLSVLEAMSFGKVIVASDIEEHQELLDDKRFLFKTSDVTDLKRVIVWTLNNPEICKVNSLQNRIRAEKDYNWEIIAQKSNDIYEELIPEEINLPLFSVKDIK